MEPQNFSRYGTSKLLKSKQENQSLRKPELSVIIPTLNEWPHIQKYLELILDQARTLKIEIIIADGHGQALPDELFPKTIWLREIGSSTFRLYALAVKHAQGRIIAFTEDHCCVSPDWCKRILNAHQKYPEAEVISGVIENGSTESLLDRVHFLIAKGPLMSPITPADAHLISGESNSSFKKHVLPEDAYDIGVPFYQSIHKQGHKTLIKDDIIVWHFQSVNLVKSCTIHFHNGKSIAGFRLPSLSPLNRLLRIVSCTLLPGFLTIRTFATVFRKRRERLILMLGLPVLLLLAMSHSAGEFFGYIIGAGDSPSKIH